MKKCRIEVQQGAQDTELVTPLTFQRKCAGIADTKKRIAKAKLEAADYQKLLAQRLKEQRERRSESLAKRRSSSLLLLMLRLRVLLYRHSFFFLAVDFVAL